MSKQAGTQSTAEQLIPGNGMLRQKIRSVRFVTDAQGHTLPLLAMRVGRIWNLLDQKKLAQCNSEEVARAATRSRIPLDLDSRERKRLCDQLLAAPKGTLVLLEPSGYQQVRRGEEVKEVFVWRGKPNWVGDTPDFTCMVRDSGQAAPPEASGSLEEWKTYAEHFGGNHYLVVALGAALSALLAKPMGVDTLSLLYIGRSSIGKGATQQAIKSIIGKPTLDSSSGTPIGMQQSYSELGGQPVFPEDLRQQRDAEALVSLFFDVGNRAARSVGHASQSAIKGKPLECLIFGTNERTLGEMLKGVKYDAGLEARVLEIQIRESIGAFHRLPEDCADGRKFSEYLKEGASRYYGSVWDAWVELAAKYLHKLRELWHERQDELLEALMTSEAGQDGLAQRVLKGVAFWMFCLQIASKRDLIPLTRKQINESFQFVIQAHTEQRRSGLTQHSEGIVNQIRSRIRGNPSKFPKLTKSAMGRDGVWGFRHQVKDRALYLLYPHVLQRLIGQDVGGSTLSHALRAAGLLFPNKDRDDRVIKMPDGSSARMFAIHAAILSDE